MSLKKETIAIHGRNDRNDQFGSLQPAIYNSSAYHFKSQSHAASLFVLQEFGNIYSRLTNPTIGALGERLAALDDAPAAVPCSSGHAAQLLTFFNLLEPGTNIVASKKLYGGSITQLSKTFQQFGWEVRFADIENISSFREAITEKSRGIFIESISNPEGKVADIEKLAHIAADARIPLIVDNSVPTPALIQTKNYGANIITYSLTKFITGSGSIIGGAVVDNGNFDWKSNPNLNLMNEPDPAYNNIIFSESFGEIAFFVRTVAVGLRDLGSTLSPYTAFLVLLALETLPLRMRQHVFHGKKIAEFLHNHKKVASLSYSPLTGNTEDKELLQKYFPQGIPPVFGFTLQGGVQAAETFINSLNLVSHVANLGDAKTLAIHPYSTTHSQLSAQEKELAGVIPGFIRISVGLENPEDIITDLDNALQAT